MSPHTGVTSAPAGARSRLFIGTSGWNYDHWGDDFYAGIRRKDRLRCYVGHFDSVEVNATFYRLQSRETFARWVAETPDHFRFAIKGNRFLTHKKKLGDPVESVLLERERALGLGDKLAVVLWQLPANFTRNIEKLNGFAEALRQWGEARHAIEFRHPSWFDEEVAACLSRYGIANCHSDAADWPMWSAVTTDVVYVRLHGHTRTYISAYSRDNLAGWGASILRWFEAGKTVYVYFDNDARGAAPKDAKRLVRLLGRN